MTNSFWTLFPLSGEDDRPGERSGGAAWQRAEMGCQIQESHRTGKHTGDRKWVSSDCSVTYSCGSQWKSPAGVCVQWELSQTQSVKPVDDIIKWYHWYGRCNVKTIPQSYVINFFPHNILGTPWNKRSSTRDIDETDFDWLFVCLLSDWAAAAEADSGERSQRPAGIWKGLHGETGTVCACVCVCACSLIVVVHTSLSIPLSIFLSLHNSNVFVSIFKSFLNRIKIDVLVLISRNILDLIF